MLRRHRCWFNRILRDWGRDATRKIDIHIHPQPGSDPTLDDYVRIMDAHDVAAALVHATPEHVWETHGESSDDAVLAACEKHPGRLFGSCYIDLRQSSSRSISKIERYAAHGFKCVAELGREASDVQPRSVRKRLAACRGSKGTRARRFDHRMEGDTLVDPAPGFRELVTCALGSAGRSCLVMLANQRREACVAARCEGVAMELVR